MYKSLHFNILYLLTLIFFASSCSKNQDFTEGDLRYTCDEAFKYFTTDPDRAMQILDSAVIVGNMSKESAELDRAKCYYVNARYDTALIIVDRLLDKKEYGKNENLHVDILVFKTQVASANGDMITMWKTAEEASTLCHQLGGDNLVYATDMDCKIGSLLVSIGEEEEGLKEIDEAIKTIGNPTELNEFQALVNCYKRKTIALMAVGKNDEVPRICDLLLGKLEHLGENGLKDNTPEDLAPFIDHSTGCFLCYKALALSVIGKNEEAKKTLNECLKTNWSQRKSAAIHLISIYCNLEMYDKCEEIYETALKDFNFGKKTNDTEVTIHNIMAKVAEAKGDKDKSIEFYEKALEEQKELNEIASKEESMKYFAMYKVNEAQQVTYEYKLHIARLRIILVIVLVIIIVLTIFTLLALHKKRKLKELAENIVEMHAPDENENKNEDDKTVNQMAMLYAKIMEYMKTKKPYVNPDFDVTQLATALYTNKSYISRTINRLEGKNFRTWLAEYRNNVIINKLCEDHYVSVEKLCEISGYANRETLSRHFKIANGITISEFKSQLSVKND